MNRRLQYSLAIFVAWIAINIVGGRLVNGSDPQSLESMITRGVSWQIVAAAIFVLGAVLFFGWRDVGLNLPPRWRSLRVFWLPALFIVVFFAAAFAFGLPPAHAMFFIVLNTIFVGFSEELACRGILYEGLRAQFTIWPAIVLSSALFGSVHILNGLMTGDFTSAIIQATAASFSGLLFMALRLRAGSILPVMILHTLWDMGLFLVSTGQVSGSMEQLGGASALHRLLPILFVTPNLLYGLYLLRHASRDEAKWRSGIA